MFAQLFTLSSYSLMESTLTIDELVKTAKELDYHAICLADEMVMHGTAEFFLACEKYQIKPLIGLIVPVTGFDQTLPVNLIAKNNVGYLALMQYSTLLNSDLKTLDFNILIEHQPNWTIILPSEGGLLEKPLLANDYSMIKDYLTYFKSVLPAAYLGISNGDVPFWRQMNAELVKIAEALALPVVALPKVRFAQAADSTTLKVLQAIKTATNLNDLRLAVNNGHHFYTTSALKTNYPASALANTLQIAADTQVTWQSQAIELPRFHQESEKYLQQLCFLGLKKRFAPQLVPELYQKRLTYELSVINSMKYADYFLIVWDLISYAKKQGIYVGPGRGSSAGSLVAYCLGITQIDPLAYGLLFERFLNPERVSLPDIDIDFPDNQRQLIIDYVAERYGYQHVAHIITFGTFGAKQAIRDVGRVLELSAKEVDVLAKLIPNQPGITLTNALKLNQRLNELINHDQRYRRLYDLALKIEGLPRHRSLHAAGIVLAKAPLITHVPLIQLDQPLLATQYSMEYLADCGLLKMDFLGLRNLTIIEEILALLPTKLDVLKLPLDDQKTYQLLQKVKTTGIFQLESAGMRQLIRKMQPAKFTDIVLAIALFRPGPMENIDRYLQARNSSEPIEYLHPALSDILADTYGIIIYQEQIMQIAQKMAGFSLGKADILRKAMGKKSWHELKKLENDFLTGCQNQGYTLALAEQLFELILKFANYGFNKSHSVAYGLIAYQMAYLKANYPLEFFCALLNNAQASSVKTKEYLDDATLSGVGYLPISINASTTEFMIVNDKIILPFTIVKNVGTVAANLLVELRARQGQFIDFFDFVAKATLAKINRKVIESLIDAGALDEFNHNRQTLHQALNEAFVYTNLITVMHQDQTSLDFSLVSKPPLIPLPDDPLDNLEQEKNVLGFYLSSHPLVQIKRQVNYTGKNILEIQQVLGNVSVLGIITKIKPYRTKTNEMMAFMTLADETGQIELVLLPKLYQRLQVNLKEQLVVYLTGELDKRGSILVKTLKTVVNYQE